MSGSTWRLVDADWIRDRDALRQVRETVFVIEQHVPADMEWDQYDPDAVHVLAVDDAGRSIGTGRLTREHAIGRMAVLPAWRGHGVGAGLLQALVECARSRGWPRVTLHAQVDAIGFYRRHGFHAHGAPFTEAGIRHRHMTLVLDERAGTDGHACSLSGQDT